MNSKKFQLSITDKAKIKRSFLVAFGGAVVVFIPDLIANIDFGVFAPFATAAAGIALNALRLWLADNTEK